MAVRVAQLRVRAEDSLVAMCYRALQEVNANSDRETAAAIEIQRSFRGFINRKRYRRAMDRIVAAQAIVRGFLVRQRLRSQMQAAQRSQRMQLYNRAATEIQRVWKGFHSRRKVFDYYARQRQIRHTIEMNRAMRQQLDQHHVQQALFEKEEQNRRSQLLLEKLAANRHHLLGTKNIPGVFGAKPKFPYVTAPSDPATALRHDKERQRLGANIHLSESDLRTNPGLSTWIQTFQKQPSHPLRERPVSPPPEQRRKLATGPFLPMYKLEQIKTRQRPSTLRVETEYESRPPKPAPSPASQGQASKSPSYHQAFTLPSLHEQSYITRGAYGPIEHGTKSFREDDPSKRIHRRDFVRNVPGIPLFDEFNI